MNYKVKKILSFLLILVYLITTLGFVISEKNCECCSPETKCEIVDENKTGCCSQEQTQTSCCSVELHKSQIQKKSCNCELLKCEKSEYIKNDHNTVTSKISVNLLNIRSFIVDEIVNDSENKLCEFLQFIKNDPPTHLFKDENYIIELSRLKIATA